MKTKKLQCTTPKIISFPVEGLKNPKRWYVYFRVAINGKKQIKRYSQGINHYNTFKLRLQAANELRDNLIISLANGWVPNDIIKQVEQTSNIPMFTEPDIHLTQALNNALKERCKKLSKKSISDYTSLVKRIIEAIEANQWHELKLKDASRMHFRRLLEHIKNNRQWGNTTYNNNLGYLKTIIQECVDMEMISVSPIMRMATLRQEESLIHNPPTEIEMNRIKSKLISVHPNMWNAYCVQYHTGIRPGEILDMQLKHIDLEQRIITIVPEINKCKTKIRYVPINEYLYDLLISMKLYMYDNEYYLFGAPVPYAGKLPNNKTFTPNKYPIKRRILSNLWKILIKQQEGINRTFYSGKKLSANHKIEDGMSEDALRHLFGHSSTMMTNIYITEKRNVYTNEINNHSRKI